MSREEREERVEEMDREERVKEIISAHIEIARIEFTLDLLDTKIEVLHNRVKKIKEELNNEK